MTKRAHHYRLRLEHLAPATPDQPTQLAVELAFTNHDDIFAISNRLEGRQLFAEAGQATEFAIELKLFSEVLLKNRAHPLFAEFGSAFREFRQRLVSRPAAPTAAPSAPGSAEGKPLSR